MSDAKIPDGKKPQRKTPDHQAQTALQGEGRKVTRDKILGELESIKYLLSEAEQLSLLSDAAAPLLTESLDHEDHASWGDDTDIPLLQDSLSFSGAEAPPATATQAAPEAPSEAAASLPSAPASTASSASTPAPGGGDSALQRPASPSLPSGDNPFLPKHIRDRLQANRLLQQEMLKGFGAPPSPAPGNPAPMASPPLSGASAQALIEELVQRYLPQIEADLRARLGELLAPPGARQTEEGEGEAGD